MMLMVVRHLMYIVMLVVNISTPKGLRVSQGILVH